MTLNVKSRRSWKTENFDKNWNIREIYKIFFTVSVQNQEDIVESDNNMWKNSLLWENYFKKSIFSRFS